MNLSKVKVLAVVLTIATAAFAQFNDINNARTRALNNAPLSDVTGVYSYPVLMMGYLNQAQVTWNGTDAASGGTGYGSFIFTKSINDMIALGVVHNSVSFLSGSGAAAPGRLPNTPHFLLGFDLGALKLGVDIFIQHTDSTTKVETVTPSVTAETKNSFTNFGTRFSADMEFGDIGLLAKLGIGLPSTLEEVTYSNETPNTKIEFDGLYLETGAELSYPLGDIDLTAGGEYINLSRQRKGNQPAPSDHLPYTKNSRALLALYLAGEVNIMETAAAVFAYEYSRRTTTSEVASGPSTEVRKTKTMDGIAAHSFYGGVENSWDDTWKFDNFQLRTGLGYDIRSVIYNQSNDRDNAETKRSEFSAHNFIKPIIGMGVSKGLLTLDMALSFGRMFDEGGVNGARDYDEWRGWLAGPTMVTTTATIKF